MVSIENIDAFAWVTRETHGGGELLVGGPLVIQCHNPVSREDMIPFVIRFVFVIKGAILRYPVVLDPLMMIADCVWTSVQGVESR